MNGIKITLKEWDAILDFLNKYREEQKQKEWPQIRDKYYYIAGHYVNSCRYTDDDIDAKLKAIGNFFKTEEEAQFKLEQIKVMHELEELADDDQPWDDSYNYDHYELYYNFKANSIYADEVFTIKRNSFCFKSIESAYAAIEKIGEDRLKKYYFCIPEDET